ncbi:MAG: hypothetical protein HON90_11715 [Halobacteriovoraceae bacterium]|jgi:hypothetical protein|nr:hypothetical protein [Halobacteriovoraceae bacterium]
MFYRLVLFIFSFTIMTFSYSEDNFLEFGNVDFGRNFKEKSKWTLKSGLSYIRYPSAFPDLEGVHESIDGVEFNELNGYSLSIGRDFYIGNSFSSELSIRGHYARTIDKVVGYATEEIKVEFAETRTAHQFSALEAVFALNYIFDYKVIDLQPFFEIGLGSGTSESEKQYSRVGLPTETEGSESYDASVSEKFSFSQISLGLNLISYKGLMSYIRFSSMQMVKTFRETTGTNKVKGAATIFDISSKESSLNESENVSVVSIGIGRYF